MTLSVGGTNNWTEIPFWAAFRRVKRTGFPGKELLSVYRDFGVVRKRDRDDNFNVESEDLSPYQLVRPGNLVINKMKAWQGSLGISPYEGIASPAYFVFEPTSSNDIRFLNHLLRSREFAGLFRALSKGIRPNQWDLDPDQLHSVKLRLPPVDEQHAIADYLDHEMAQIDALVAKQEEFIGLLLERRDAVVRVEIMQQIDLHPVDKLGRSAKVGNGSTPRRDAGAYWHGGVVPWLTSTAVNLPEVVTADQFVTETAVRECHLPMVDPDSLLIGLIGQGPTRGMATINRLRATLSQNLAYIAPDRTKWVPEYLLWALRASYSDIRQKGAESGTAQGLLNTDDIRRVCVAMPPIPEQHRVVARLNIQTSRIDALIAKTEEHIALAKERRSALISAAVTGQFDVRTARKAA